MDLPVAEVRAEMLKNGSLRKSEQIVTSAGRTPRTVVVERKTSRRIPAGARLTRCRAAPLGLRLYPLSNKFSVSDELRRQDRLRAADEFRQARWTNPISVGDFHRLAAHSFALPGRRILGFDRRGASAISHDLRPDIIL